MNYGMIGAIGGAGAGFAQQGKFLEKEEHADAQAGREKNLQAWLMQKREEFAIAAEGRAETRAVASEDRGEARTVRTEDRTDQRTEKKADRDFERAQREAPVRRTIKAEDTKSDHRAKSDATAETLQQDAVAVSTLAEAKETDAEKDLRHSTADYYSGRNEAGGKTGASKLSPEDAAELKSIQADLREKRSIIDKARADGSWNDDAPLPGQKKIQSELIAMQKRERELIAASRAARGAAPGADPLKQRAPGAGGAAPSGGAGQKVDAKIGGPEQSGRDAEAGALIVRNEYGGDVNKARAALEQAKAELVRTKGSDAQGILKGYIGRLEAGINSMSGGAAPAPGMIGGAATPANATGATPAKPAATPAKAPAAPGSARAQLEAITGGGYIPDDYNAEGNGAPRGAPAAGGGFDRAAAVQQLKAKAGGAAAAPSGGATTAGDPLLTAMGADGGSSIAQMQAQRAPQLRAAAEAIRAAQAEVVQAAHSQQQGAVQAATQKVQAASAALNAMLKDMNPAQADAIKKALGVV
jgi:hypothetical protein